LLETMAVVAVIAAGLLCAMSAQAQPGPRFWGVHYRYAKVSQEDLDRMQGGNVGTVAWPLYWPHVEPTNGVFDWSVPDRIIGSFASRGIRVVPVLSSSPSYAARTPATPPLGSAAARQDWKQFLRAAVERYGHGGDYWAGGLLSPYHLDFGFTAPSQPISAWQIWNEPNLPKFFASPSPVRQYAKLLHISHDPILGVDPRASVVLAGLPGFDGIRLPSWRFLNRLYGIPGTRNDFEVAAAHPYGAGLAEISGQMERLRKTMKRHHDRQTQIWITELGFGSARPNGRLDKGLRGQKRALKRSFELILRKRRRWNVGLLTWFEWRDPPPHTVGCSFCRSAGLFRHNREPKPSWRAYKHFTANTG